MITPNTALHLKEVHFHLSMPDSAHTGIVSTCQYSKFLVNFFEDLNFMDLSISVKTTEFKHLENQLYSTLYYAMILFT